MQNLFFAVEYEATIRTQTLPDGSADITRILTLHSVRQTNDMYSEAILTFDQHMTRPGTTVPLAIVEHTEVRRGVHRIEARLPLAEFEYYYDLVRSEAPIAVGFAEEPSLPGAPPKRTIQVTTGREPSGEGDADALTRPR